MNYCYYCDQPTITSIDSITRKPVCSNCYNNSELLVQGKLKKTPLDKRYLNAGIEVRFKIGREAVNILKKFINLSRNCYIIDFGFEKSIWELKGIQDLKFTNDAVLKRVRCMPDLLVYNIGDYGQRSHGTFIESKFTSANINCVPLSRMDLQNYRIFWPETIIVVTVNNLQSKVFYALGVESINDSMIVKTEEKNGDTIDYYNVEGYFESFEDNLENRNLISKRLLFELNSRIRAVLGER